MQPDGPGLNPSLTSCVGKLLTSLKQLIWELNKMIIPEIFVPFPQKGLRDPVVHRNGIFPNGLACSKGTVGHLPQGMVGHLPRARWGICPRAGWGICPGHGGMSALQTGPTPFYTS